MKNMRLMLLALGALGACTAQDRADSAAVEQDTTAVLAEWTEARLSQTEIDSARYEASWRVAPSIDSLIARDSLAARGLPVDSIVTPEQWEHIAAVDDSVAGGAVAQLPPVRLPLGGQVSGPSVLYAQILLDRSPFSPGVIDGRWGKNTEKAVFWLQQQQGLPATGQIDSATFHALAGLAGSPDRYLTTVALTAEDVAGPFEPVPEDVYRQAEGSCLCYESLAEKLAERFHVTEEVLAQLNRGVQIAGLTAGDSLKVPNLQQSGMAERTAGDSAGTGTGGTGGKIARLVISDQGHYLHAVDSAGRILRHFPTTLGSSFAPSPTGELTVTRITRNPWFHWQPKLLEGVPDHKKPARLPPGPNSPVGVVWIALSEPHFGIHGTNHPASIGYTTSSGCVRLTNWDASMLAGMIGKGTRVEFRDLGLRGVALR
jgi:lipoprotein-anchoring transpeptidase ErfK/SrfK